MAVTGMTDPVFVRPTGQALLFIKGPNRVLIQHSTLSPPIMSSSERPLPYGWVQEFDPKTNHPFWVSNTSVPSPYYIHD